MYNLSDNSSDSSAVMIVNKEDWSESSGNAEVRVTSYKNHNCLQNHNEKDNGFNDRPRVAQEVFSFHPPVLQKQFDTNDGKRQKFERCVNLSGQGFSRELSSHHDLPLLWLEVDRWQAFRRRLTTREAMWPTGPVSRTNRCGQPSKREGMTDSSGGNQICRY